MYWTVVYNRYSSVILLEFLLNSETGDASLTGQISFSFDQAIAGYKVHSFTSFFAWQWCGFVKWVVFIMQNTFPSFFTRKREFRQECKRLKHWSCVEIWWHLPCILKPLWYFLPITMKYGVNWYLHSCKIHFHVNAKARVFCTKLKAFTMYLKSLGHVFLSLLDMESWLSRGYVAFLLSAFLFGRTNSI